MSTNVKQGIKRYVWGTVNIDRGTQKVSTGYSKFVRQQKGEIFTGYSMGYWFLSNLFDIG